jgi:LPXTG-motif cell wall-anchored protein
VLSPPPSEWTYLVYDGFNNATPTTYPAVLVRPTVATTTTVRRPDPVGPPGLPIALAGVLVLGGVALWLTRRRRHPPASLA